MEDNWKSAWVQRSSNERRRPRTLSHDNHSGEAREPPAIGGDSSVIAANNNNSRSNERITPTLPGVMQMSVEDDQAAAKETEMDGRAAHIHALLSETNDDDDILPTPPPPPSAFTTRSRSTANSAMTPPPPARARRWSSAKSVRPAATAPSLQFQTSEGEPSLQRCVSEMSSPGAFPVLGNRPRSGSSSLSSEDDDDDDSLMGDARTTPYPRRIVPEEQDEEETTIEFDINNYDDGDEYYGSSRGVVGLQNNNLGVASHNHQRVEVSHLATYVVEAHLVDEDEQAKLETIQQSLELTTRERDEIQQRLSEMEQQNMAISPASSALEALPEAEPCGPPIKANNKWWSKYRSYLILLMGLVLLGVGSAVGILLGRPSGMEQVPNHGNNTFLPPPKDGGDVEVIEVTKSCNEELEPLVMTCLNELPWSNACMKCLEDNAGSLVGIESNCTAYSEAVCSPFTKDDECSGVCVGCESLLNDIVQCRLAMFDDPCQVGCVLDDPSRELPPPPPTVAPTHGECQDDLEPVFSECTKDLPEEHAMACQECHDELLFFKTSDVTITCEVYNNMYCTLLDASGGQPTECMDACGTCLDPLEKILDCSYRNQTSDQEDCQVQCSVELEMPPPDVNCREHAHGLDFEQCLDTLPDGGEKCRSCRVELQGQVKLHAEGLCMRYNPLFCSFFYETPCAADCAGCLPVVDAFVQCEAGLLQYDEEPLCDGLDECEESRAFLPAPDRANTDDPEEEAVNSTATNTTTAEGQACTKQGEVVTACVDSLDEARSCGLCKDQAALVTVQNCTDFKDHFCSIFPPDSFCALRCGHCTEKLLDWMQCYHGLEDSSSCTINCTATSNRAFPLEDFGYLP